MRPGDIIQTQQNEEHWGRKRVADDHPGGAVEASVTAEFSGLSSTYPRGIELPCLPGDRCRCRSRSLRGLNSVNYPQLQRVIMLRLLMTPSSVIPPSFPLLPRLFFQSDGFNSPLLTIFRFQGQNKGGKVACQSILYLSFPVDVGEVLNGLFVDPMPREIAPK